jgi:predicted DNA-binding protein (MmcQ/YjbR family)
MASDIFARPVFARARRLCLSFPETTETASWGHPNFRAGRKIFCAFEMIRGRPSIAFRLPDGVIDELLASGQGFSTPYGRSRWASLWVDGDVDWPKVTALVEASYRTVANKHILRELSARTSEDAERRSGPRRRR